VKRNSKTWERKLKRLAERLEKLAGTFESEELAKMSGQLLKVAQHPVDYSKVKKKGDAFVHSIEQAAP